MAGAFSGRTCVVTGGSYGIGYATAARFLREDADVVICARNPEKLAQAQASLSEISDRCSSFALDISDLDGVTAFAASIEELGNGADVLVNNAFSQVGATVADSTTEQWLANFAATLHGTYYMTRALIPMLRRSGRGAIVNISSLSGSLVVPGTSGYGAAKAGVEQLTRVTAIEEARHGIRSNALVVGGVATPALDKLVGGNWDLVGRGVPLGRVAQADEIANAIAFLASDQASYVTAAVLHADGGLNAVMAQNVDQSEYHS